MLRKFTPYLLAVGLLAAYLAGPNALNALLAWLHHVPDVTSGPSASGAEIEAAQQAGGWMQAGAITSKLLAASAFYVVLNILRWFYRQVSHPRPAAWAKGEYSADFDSLSPAEKFQEYGRIRLSSALLAVAAAIFGALAQ